jgi:phosphoenolpyruvate synthase/pyruvate phosphate dikinase
VPKKFLYYCSVDELADWLENGKEIPGEILQARMKFCVWVAHDERSQDILIGDEARKYLRENGQEEKIEIKEVLVIHGAVASPGYARGTVKIVNKTSEIDKVGVGDILVSVATNPSLLPAMKKAAAFITDAGGINSHAAIVARELGKPCIIGTKIATKVLKDGDQVEIDTKIGNVKKL